MYKVYDYRGYAYKATGQVVEVAGVRVSAATLDEADRKACQLVSHRFRSMYGYEPHSCGACLCALLEPGQSFSAFIQDVQDDERYSYR